MKINIENHPCFNRDIAHKYARIHLPVASKCNIQCNYCNRKFSCVNESRPGVTADMLSPFQAIAYLDTMIKKVPNISTIGIAGPGDSFAEPETTLKTLDLVNEKYPDLLLCLATNGLNLYPYLEQIKKFNLTHLTITVNTLNPETGAKIYSWIRWNKKLYQGKAGAEILIENQKIALSGLKDMGIVIKVNTIYLPGINDNEILETAEILKSYNVNLMNVVPYYKTDGAVFADMNEPSLESIKGIREKAGKIIPQMLHCQRCRADAAGLLCQKKSMENINILKEFASLPIIPTENRKYVAVGTREGFLVNLHLGEVKEFYIYESEEGKNLLKEIRKAPLEGSGDNRWETLSQILNDCKAVIVSGVGEKPRSFIEKSGLRLYVYEGILQESVEAIFENRASEFFEKRKQYSAFSCKKGCLGSALGCG